MLLLGGAAHSMEDYYLLPARGTELELIESISLHGDDNDYNQIRYYHDNEGDSANEISEEEYQEIRDKYVELKGIRSYQATADNVQMLQRGELEWITTPSESTSEKEENEDESAEGKSISPVLRIWRQKNRNSIAVFPVIQ